MNVEVRKVCLLAAVCGALLAQSPPGGNPGHEMLDSALWVQTSVEHDAAFEQVYRQARLQLGFQGVQPWVQPLVINN